METTIFRIWLLISLSIALATTVYGQKQPHFQANRTTIVHLFEWTWPAIANECEQFLGPNGYGGVQISPPNEVRVLSDNVWWARYQPVSYLLKSRSGNERELREMIQRCNRSGVRIYVDAVINHMTGYQEGTVTGTGGSTANYVERSYPAVPYGPEDFNPACTISDYNNPNEVRNCQLSSLLDLNQTQPHVRQAIADYLNKLIDLGVAGFRIDGAKHMWPQDLAVIFDKLKDLSVDAGFERNARPFIYQEVIDLGGETIKSSDYNQLGCVTEFKVSDEIGRLFRGKNQLKWLRNWGTAWSLLPNSDAFVFVDNHDNQRGHGAGGADVLTFKAAELYKIATVFLLAHPYGQVTRIMSSYTFENTDRGPPLTSSKAISTPTYLNDGRCDTQTSGWVCEHRWPAIANMVQFRNIVAASALTNWWDNGANQIAFERQGRGFVAINGENGIELSQNLQTGLPAGIYCDIISGDKQSSGVCSGEKLTVGNDGKIQLSLGKGPSAAAIHLSSKL